MLKAMSKLQGALKMFMLGMLKTILKTMLKYEKKTITLYGTCRNWAADFVFLLQFCTSYWSETYLFLHFAAVFSFFISCERVICSLNYAKYCMFLWSKCNLVGERILLSSQGWKNLRLNDGWNHNCLREHFNKIYSSSICLLFDKVENSWCT